MRVQARDSAAEDEFVRTFQRRIFGFALANSKDPDWAEELAQEVLWAVIRALREGRVQQTGDLPAFVLGTARNLLNEKFRTRARQKLDALTPEIEPVRPAVEQQAFERNHAARQAIATLEAHERAVLLLSLIDGLGPEEIAHQLGITPEAVRQRKSRALKKLSEILSFGSQKPRPGLLKNIDAP